jgi:RAB protein geranylgeranyltransferase component A
MMKHDQRSAFAEKLWRDKEVPSLFHRYCKQFLEYCQLADFSIRSIQALTIRLNEFKVFLKSQRIRLVKKITCRHLINFVADHKDHSNHFNQ